MLYRTWLFAMLLALFGSGSLAQELMYDPEKGIIFSGDEKSAPAKTTTQTLPDTSGDKVTTKTVVVQKQITTPGLKTVKAKGDRVDLHVGRKEDPPDLFFASGLEYFKNNDYRNALKNFMYADSIKPQPVFALWVGKTLRQLGKHGEMLGIMKRILEKYPDSDVADDALFEMAVYYQTTDDYESAAKLYTQLAEQYPFGLSFASGEEYRDIAREQRRFMRAEMVSLLTMLGFGEDDLAASYRKFQSAKGLEVTGTGDRKTIKAIKRTHQEHQDKETEWANKVQAAGQHLYLAITAGAVGLLNLLLMIFLRIKIRSRHREVVAFRQTLSDLDIGKLKS